MHFSYMQVLADLSSGLEIQLLLKYSSLLLGLFSVFLSCSEPDQHLSLNILSLDDEVFLFVTVWGGV